MFIKQHMGLQVPGVHVRPVGLSCCSSQSTRPLLISLGFGTEPLSGCQSTVLGDSGFRHSVSMG